MPRNYAVIPSPTKGVSAKRQQQQQQQQQGETSPPVAELTVSCAMTEMRHYHSQSKRPAQDAQTYLQHRVEEIVSQIKSSSSAHHFLRHVVEIDELLRCDAPMGFTPTMVLAGIPDILFMLSRAVMQGYLLQPIEENSTTAQALTPIRRSPIAIINPKVKTTVIPLAEQRGVKTIHRPVASRGNSVRSTKGISLTGSSSNSSSVGDVAASTNVLSFLPPLVRLPTSPPNSNNVLPVSAAAATAAAAKTTNENGQRPKSVKQIQENTSTKNYVGEKATSVRKRKGGNPLSNALSETGMVILPKQVQSPTSTLREYDESNSLQSTPVLRDIPAALQALLYHCALPLVCLTPEDHRQRSAAVRILATAMASMLQVTPETMSQEWRSSSLKESNSEDNGSEKKNGEEKSISISQSKDVSFKIRHAALVSLHTLMTLIATEELTELNQHFSPRDRKRYNEAITEEYTDPSMTGNTNGIIVDLQLRRQQTQQKQPSLVEKGDEMSILTVSPQSDSASSGERVFRLTGLRQKNLQVPTNVHGNKNNTGPLSIYNDAVAVDVLSPLVDRWNELLHHCVPPNALLDSGRQLYRHPATIDAPSVYEMKEGEEEAKMSMVVVTNGGSRKRGISPIESLDGLTVIAPRVRMSEEDAKEIYLLLRVCLHLSTYKHHARYLVEIGNGNGETSVGLAVLLCLTIARCTEGDHCLPLCVECLWNLLEVVPQETVHSILYHVVNRDDDWESASLLHQKESTGKMLGSLSLLSATESLLQGFVQILLSGHRVRQREIRNDMVILLQMILNNSTATIQEQIKNLMESSDADIPSPLPRSTVNAINTIALTVFDLVCGPELRMIGSTAKMTRRPVEEFVRYHTVISPTTRVENMQFKLLAWRLLESFHSWQAARLALKNLSRRRKQQTKLSSSATTVTSEQNTNSAGGGGPSIDDSDHHNDDEDLLFDVCRCGFIDVLLLYIDTTCGDELVLAWTREELLTLQEEAWRLLLSLMESAASIKYSASAVKYQLCDSPTKMKATTTTITSSHNSVSSLPNAHMEFLIPASLSNADNVFVAADGIGCAVRYIRQATTADAERMVSLAVRVLSVISRTPAHLCKILASEAMNSISISSYGEPTPLLLNVAIHMVKSHLKRSLHREPILSKLEGTTTTTTTMTGTVTGRGGKGESNTGKIGMRLRKEIFQNTNTSSKHSSSSSHVEEGKKTVEEKQPYEITAKSSSSTEKNKRWYTQLRNDNNIEKYSLTVHSQDIINHCLLLMYNIAEGNSSTVSSVQQAFLSMGGVSLLLLLLRISLSQLVSSFVSSVSKVNEWDNELMSAVLHCVRAFILGNVAAEEEFVQEDGIHIFLSVVEFFAKLSQNEDETKPIEYNIEEDSNLSLLLSILADLLRECPQARDAFLQWSSLESQKIRDLDDDGFLNATQLLLRLWKEEPVTVPTWTEMCAIRGEAEYTRYDVQNLQEVKEAFEFAEQEQQEEVEGGKETVVKNNTDPSMISSKYKLNKTGEIPILRADWWGLQLIGLHGRETIINELQNRFNELQRNELMTEGYHLSPDLLKQEARKRLAETMCHVLGLHVKIYACFAAVGFDRLADVKATALERVKLLHVAALPSVCRDEVWGAIAEAVDLRSRAWIVPATGSSPDNKGVDSSKDDSVKRFAVIPILPDADQLVKVLLDVEARAHEMQHLVRVCTDMHTAQEDEDTRRFLLSRLRQSTDDPAVATLVQEARKTNEQKTFSGGIARSVLEHVMDRFPRQQDRTSYSVPCISANDITLSDNTIPLQMTMLEKKRKRDMMIRSSIRDYNHKSANVEISKSNTM
ncbi:uncharacterized protein TM35_000011570 [Trypanosoma theileri]|uniref:Uncharacterized protein n=1 Tax=Trypanosoma theileri TaxID=67003 RepID=A0A1X0P9Z5_9TRYP|nr:uncharacterized protein TM35_000011570 [Trypanosoma theileri]ORC93280.1 hypothetical protein TM35_000011570 [Trypanosoma theileri]